MLFNSALRYLTSYYQFTLIGSSGLVGAGVSSTGSGAGVLDTASNLTPLVGTFFGFAVTLGTGLNGMIIYNHVIDHASSVLKHRFVRGPGWMHYRPIVCKETAWMSMSLSYYS